MKNALLILILTGLLVSSTNAQVKIGLMGGMNFSTAYQQQFFFADAEYKTKMLFGGIVDIQLSRHISICLEPLYIEKGSERENVLIGNITPNVSFDMSYFEIPILFKYSTGKYLRPYIVAGPAIGFNLGSDLSAGALGFEIGFDAGDYMRTVELSFDIGGGISYEADDIITFFVEAKYGFGLNDIVKHGNLRFDFADIHEWFTIPKNTRYNNRGLQLTFGFMLPLSAD